eukprot:RCo045202
MLHSGFRAFATRQGGGRQTAVRLLLRRGCGDGRTASTLCCTRTWAPVALVKGPGLHRRVGLLLPSSLAPHCAVLRGFSSTAPSSGDGQDRVWTIPNILTMSRIIITPAICAALYCDATVVALVGLVYAAATDWLDGYLARKLNQTSSLGAKLDPFADKVFVNSVAIVLVLKGCLPMYVLAVFALRDVGLIVGYFCYKAYTAPGVPLRDLFRVDRDTDIQIKASALSKLNTGLQCGLLISALSSVYFPSSAVLPAVVHYGSGVVCGTTVASAIHYATTLSGIQRRDTGGKSSGPSP